MKKIAKVFRYFKIHTHISNLIQPVTYNRNNRDVNRKAYILRGYKFCGTHFAGVDKDLR